jgi:hypothetical protein
VAKLKQVGIDVDVHRAIETARQSFSETENDILRRLLLNVPSPRSQRASERQPVQSDQVRTRGLWSVEVLGERMTAANLKDAYRTLLLKLDEIAPDFLLQFSTERARSRRFIARNPQELYDSSPHLAADHAKQLKDEWYFDTNLSAEQVAKRARAAARVAGLNYGRDVKVMENLRLI